MIAATKLLPLVVFLCCVASAPAYAQEPLFYENGRFEDIKGKRRLYVGPRQVRGSSGLDAIEMRIRGRHGLRIVRNGSVADFMLHFEYLPNPSARAGSRGSGHTARLQVFQVRRNVVFVLWDKKAPEGTPLDSAARSLADQFLKDFGAMSGRK